MRRQDIRIDNLRALALEFGSVAEVARRAGTAETHLRNVLNGVKTAKGASRSIGDRLAAKLEHGCGKPSGWLDREHVEFGEGVDSALLGDVTSQLPSSPAGSARPVSLSPGQIWLDRHPAIYPSTSEGYVGSSDVITKLQVDPDGLRQLLGQTPITHVEALRLVTARGDSMVDTIRPGDVMLVDTGVTVPDHDGIYMLQAEQDTLLKRLQRRSDGSWLLISDNTRYTPEIVTRDDKARFRVWGRVVYSWNGRAL